MGKAGANSGDSGEGKRSADAAGEHAAGGQPASASRHAGHNGADAPAARDQLADDKALTFTIHSDFSAGHDVQKRILDAVERAGFDAESTFAIKLALEEALINAIKHGNKLDLKKQVHIQASVSPQTTEITIEDQGPGFDRASVPDPTLEENLDKCSGRGILLMEAYMNRVEWSQGGRRVFMVKKNEREGVRG